MSKKFFHTTLTLTAFVCSIGAFQESAQADTQTVTIEIEEKRIKSPKECNDPANRFRCTYERNSHPMAPPEPWNLKEEGSSVRCPPTRPAPDERKYTECK